MGFPIPIIGDIINIVGDILDKVIPDKDAREKAKHEIEMTLVSQDFHLRMGQLDINKEEAKHQSVFVAGWRPAIGWCGAIALFYHFIGFSLMEWILKVTNSGIVPPAINSDNLMELVLGILGLGGMRSYERIKGVIPPQK